MAPWTRAAVAGGCAALAASAGLNISNVFGAHMVIQCDAAFSIWGWGCVNGQVSSTLDGSAFSTRGDATGFWQQGFPAQPPSFQPHNFSFTCSVDDSSATLVDVLMGDVYYISGQSNAEYTTNAAFNATAEIAAANNYPYLRVTSGPLQGAYNLNAVGNHSYTELQAVDLPWSVATNVTIGCPTCTGWDYYSALAWFTIRNLADALAAVGKSRPIGGIVQSYGGTSIQYWSSPASIAECAAPPGSACCNYGGSDSCLWNSQVAPYFVGGPGAFPISGMVWYQGEQNAGCGGVPQIAYYDCALPSLIADYRAHWGNPALPFGAVFLAAWQADTPYFPQMRLSVGRTVASVPNTFAVSAIDRGDPAGGPVHSPYKQDVGKRAALGMLNLVYGQDVPFRGPRATGATALGTTVTVAFDPASLYGQQLVFNASVVCPSTITASSCETFAVQTAIDCTWWTNVTAGLTADGLGLALSLPAGAPATAQVVATRGYYANWPIVRLYNAEGLPAEPWVLNITGVANPCPSILHDATNDDAAAAAVAYIQHDAGMPLEVFA